MKVLHCVRNGWRLVAFRGSLYPQRFFPLLCATDKVEAYLGLAARGFRQEARRDGGEVGVVMSDAVAFCFCPPTVGAVGPTKIVCPCAPLG